MKEVRRMRADMLKAAVLAAVLKVTAILCLMPSVPTPQTEQLL